MPKEFLWGQLMWKQGIIMQLLCDGEHLKVFMLASRIVRAHGKLGCRAMCAEACSVSVCRIFREKGWNRGLLLGQQWGTQLVQLEFSGPCAIWRPAMASFSVCARPPSQPGHVSKQGGSYMHMYVTGTKAGDRKRKNRRVDISILSFEVHFHLQAHRRMCMRTIDWISYSEHADYTVRSLGMGSQVVPGIWGEQRGRSKGG